MPIKGRTLIQSKHIRSFEREKNPGGTPNLVAYSLQGLWKLAAGWWCISDSCRLLQALTEHVPNKLNQSQCVNENLTIDKIIDAVHLLLWNDLLWVMRLGNGHWHWNFLDNSE